MIPNSGCRWQLPPAIFSGVVFSQLAAGAARLKQPLGCAARGLRLRPLQVKGGLKMKTEWAFLAGLGVGAVAGLVAGLMVAPQSGKDTQELLAGKLRGGLDQVASAGKKVRAQVKDLANRGKENVAEAIDAGQEAYRTSGTEG